MPEFSKRLGLQQRVLPAYRAPFFNALGASCSRGLSIFAGKPQPGESISTVEKLRTAQLVSARNLHFSNPASPYYLCWQRGLRGWLESWQPEALIVEANPRYLSTRLAVQWMQSRGRPVIGWGLGAPPLVGRFALLRRWERLSFLRSLDGIIAYSRRGAEEYRSLGLEPGRVFIAPNAAVPRPAAPPLERPGSFHDRPSVLFVGRLQARKRIDLLLCACAALPDPLRPRLRVVGDGPARVDLEKLAAEVYPEAEFLGARQGPELDPYFDQADLFVLPGTGGLAIQQAMAHALPVIVAQGDGTQDDLVGPQNGWLVPPGNLETLKKALLLALSDVNRLRRFGQESYRIVAEEANLESMVAVFIHALNTLAVKEPLDDQSFRIKA